LLSARKLNAQIGAWETLAKAVRWRQLKFIHHVSGGQHDHGNYTLGKKREHLELTASIGSAITRALLAECSTLRLFK
jgi:hypothetical protein